MTIGNATDGLISLNSARVERTTIANEIPAAPASALASPAETARAQGNQAALMHAMMAPTADGIFTIGSVSVKTNASNKGAAISTSWGFG